MDQFNLFELNPDASNALLGSYVYHERGLRIKAERSGQPMVQVVVPNGGESLYLGALDTISWNGMGLAGALVKLELLVGGAVAGTIVENLPGTQTSYQWQVGKTLTGTVNPGTDYKVRVTAVVPMITSGATCYFYDSGGKLLSEYDGTGTCVKDYLYLGGKMIGEYLPATSAYYYYASDQINSTRLVTDGTGTVVHSAQYDPYGGLYKTWIDTYHPKPGFSGKEREFGSEMDYFGARYFGHKQYRFISVDPIIGKDKAIGNPQFWNLYSYCGNNPINVIDPDGLDNYVFYDSKNFSSQAKAEAKRLGALNNETTHMMPISNTSEFVNNWNSMKDPTNVSLMFHSGSTSSDGRKHEITIDRSTRQYLTTNPDGRTSGTGSPSVYLGSLEKKEIGTLNLNICNSFDLMTTFAKTQNVENMIGYSGPVNYNPPDYSLRVYTWLYKWVLTKNK